MAAHSQEKTFKQFTPSQAAAYATGRGQYPQALYDAVYDFHTSNSPPGSFGTVVDLGCGPGNSTLPFIGKFDHVVGIDPSEGMIETANKEILALAKEETQTNVRFIHGRAEDIDGVEAVDMIVAATAAHWFDLPKFWESASRVLKPGGTVALWTTASLYCHPAKTTNPQRVQETLDRLEKEYLAPYEVKGNKLCREYYDELLLPWQCKPPIKGFTPDKYKRTEWDRDGLDEGSEEFLMKSQLVTLAQVEKNCGTASMVVRWREAHPDLAHTDDDIVVKARRELREVLGRDVIDIGKGCVLLLFAKE